MDRPWRICKYTSLVGKGLTSWLMDRPWRICKFTSLVGKGLTKRLWSQVGILNLYRANEPIWMQLQQISLSACRLMLGQLKKTLIYPQQWPYFSMSPTNHLNSTLHTSIAEWLPTSVYVYKDEGVCVCRNYLHMHANICCMYQIHLLEVTNRQMCIKYCSSGLYHKFACWPLLWVK